MPVSVAGIPLRRSSAFNVESWNFTSGSKSNPTLTEFFLLGMEAV